MIIACTIAGFATLLGLAHWSGGVVDVRDPSDITVQRLVPRRVRRCEGVGKS